MKILAVDTSTKNCSICIIENETVRVEISMDNGQTHSKHLMKMIRDGLDLAACKTKDLDGYAVVIGPGSFTGLRIGLSTIKGLAVYGKKPVVGISSLEALAFQCCPSPYPICVILDARKKEVYSCTYQCVEDFPKSLGEEKVGPLSQAIIENAGPCLYMGDGAVLYRQFIKNNKGEKAIFVPNHENRIRASSVAHLGLNRILKNDAGSLETLSPRYIRPPDAKMKQPSLV